MVTSSKETILLDGVTGYLGSRIAELFAKHCLGAYHLRMSVHDLAAGRHLFLRDTLGEEAFSQIQFVQADLLNKEEVAASVAGVDYIVSSAGTTVGEKGIADEI
jgi:uncharacterized protein YbjT (DUF2867 family)